MCKKIIAIFIVPLMLSLFIIGCEPHKQIDAADSDFIVDMAGREVLVPNKVETVYATGSIGTIMLYTLAPEMLAGWNNDLKESEKKYIDSEYHGLPNLGAWKGTKYTGSIEELLKVSPDIIINMGDVDEKYISDSEEIQKQLGIPVLMVDGNIEKTAEAYKFLGSILGKEKRAKILGDYYIETLKEVKDKIYEIPKYERVSLYYAEGPKGLETDAKGSINTEIIDMAGAINVADPGSNQFIRRMQVSLEQVLEWNPDVIIISTDGDETHQVYNTITTNKGWEFTQAVENREVYEIPAVPYDWINRPPSVNRIIGVKWLANLLYPDIYVVDIQKEIKEFFALFYSYDLSNDEINGILEYASRK